MKKLFLFSFLFILGASAQAQDAITIVEGGGDLNVLYRNEMDGGLVVHSGGVGANFRRIWHVTAEKKRVFETELVTMRHLKEVKTVNPTFPNSKGFYYGKLNSIFLIRPSYGFQKTLFRRAERKSVEVRYVTFFGPSMAFAKPVYLEITNEIGANQRFFITTERYDPDQHQLNDIYGRAPYLKGVEQMRIHPGGFVKFGLSFEYADIRTDVKAIEVGVVLDVYPKRIPIMAHITNQPYFFNFYLNFIYGRKWF